MKILTWNLNHRAGRIRITPEKMKKVAEALALLDADINVLTEYVPDESYHELFESELDRFGYSYRMISPYYCEQKKVTHNRIFCASRLPLTQGNILPPVRAIDGVRNNIFHVNYNALGIIGLRMPLFSNTKKKDQIPIISDPWWEWVTKIARDNIHQPFIFIGDFNCDLARKTEEDGLRLESLAREGWTHAIPKDTHVKSFYRNPDSKGTTIDHAFLSPQLILKKAEFIIEKGPYHFAKHNEAISDHAVLLVEFDLPTEIDAS